MHDLVAGVLALSSLAVWIEAARCGRPPRMYTGGVDLLDRPARQEGVQRL